MKPSTRKLINEFKASRIREYDQMVDLSIDNQDCTFNYAELFNLARLCSRLKLRYSLQTIRLLDIYAQKV